MASLRADLGHWRAQRLPVRGPDPGHFRRGLAEGDAKRAMLGEPPGEPVDIEARAVGEVIRAQIVPASACTIMGVRRDASASSRSTACMRTASSLALTQAIAAICHPRSAQAQHVLGYGRGEPLGSQHCPHLRGAGSLRAFLPALTFALVDLDKPRWPDRCRRWPAARCGLSPRGRHPQAWPAG